MPRIKKDYMSPRGVYYDLEKSPYIYEDELGNKFKFSSKAKLRSFEIKVKKKELDFAKEAKRLEELNYDITKDYLFNQKRLPEIVYNGMLYK